MREKKQFVRKTKSNPNIARRLGVWRSLVNEQKRQLYYVTLTGECVFKPNCFSAASFDKPKLRELNLKDHEPLAQYVRYMPIYTNNWSDDPCSFHHWYLPDSVIRAYESINIFSLYTWQAECLALSLGDQYPKTRVIPNDTASINQIDTHNKYISNCEEKYSLENSCPRFSTPKSILYAAPTSGGKSLVMEILIARAAIFYGKRSLIVLPHVALCDEKVQYFRAMFGPATVGLRIEAFHSSEGSAATWHSGIDIAICTIEKANGILNKLLFELKEELMLVSAINEKTNKSFRTRFSTIGVIAIDELHLVSDPQRGFLLELLLTKIRKVTSLLKSSYLSPFINHEEIQLVGLSATLPNIQDVAAWMKAECYATTVRPLPLEIFYKVNDEVISIGRYPERRQKLPSQYLCIIDPLTMKRSTTIDRDHLGYLVWERYSQRQQCLVFCATKEWCQTSCRLLTKILPFYGSSNLVYLQGSSELEAMDNSSKIVETCSKDLLQQHQLKGTISVTNPQFTSDAQPINKTGFVLDHNLLSFVEIDYIERKDLQSALIQASLSGSPCPILLQSVLQGVGYHHAGLTSEERLLIEAAFRKGTLLVLCATSTLAVGVNLPVCRVIFRSTQIGTANLDAAAFRQMSGRAGRKGFDVKGEAVVMCTNTKEAALVQNVLTAKIDPIKSVLNGMRLARLTLELIVLGLVTTFGDLCHTIFKESFLACQVKQLVNIDARKSAEQDILDDLRRSIHYLHACILLVIPDYNDIQHSRLKACEPSILSLVKYDGHEGSYPMTSIKNNCTDICFSLNYDTSINLIQPSDPTILKSLSQDKDRIEATYTLAFSSSDQQKTPISDPLTSIIVLTPFFSALNAEERFADVYREYSSYYKVYQSIALKTELHHFKKRKYEPCAIKCNDEYTLNSFLLPLALINPRTNKISAENDFFQNLTSLYDNQPLLNTVLGTAIVETSLSVAEGIELFSDLYRARILGISLKTELHLLVLTSPLNHVANIPWENYLKIISHLNTRALQVAHFFGINAESITYILSRRDILTSSSKYDFYDYHVSHERWLAGRLTVAELFCYKHLQNMRRFYYALILFDIINEVPLDTISQRFSIRVGTIQTLKARAVLMAGLLAVFCSKLEWRELGAACRQLAEILQKCYSTDADKKLNHIPFGRRAEALLTAGLDSVEAIAACSIQTLSHALEPLYRFEISQEEEANTARRRQIKLRDDIAFKILTAAKYIVDQQLQDIIDEAE